MRTTFPLAVLALASSAIATVVLSAGTACGTTTTEDVATTAGICYNTNSDEWHSAVGCSTNHYLRIHKTTDCTDDTNSYEQVSGTCATFGSTSDPILSFKCVDIW